MRAILDEAQRLAREGVDEAFYQQLRRASFGSTLRALNSFGEHRRIRCGRRVPRL